MYDHIQRARDQKNVAGIKHIPRRSRKMMYIWFYVCMYVCMYIYIYMYISYIMLYHI